MSKVMVIVYGQMGNLLPHISFGLALMSTITRPCVPYMTQICLFKSKVTRYDQMKNLYLVHNFLIPLLDLGTRFHHKICRKKDAYVDKVSVSKVTGTNSKFIIRSAFVLLQ